MTSPAAVSGMNEDGATLIELAARDDLTAIGLAGVLCYCASEIERYRAALVAVRQAEIPDSDETPGDVATHALGIRSELDAAMQHFPPALAWNREAFLRRAAFLERECHRKDREIAQLKADGGGEGRTQWG